MADPNDHLDGKVDALGGKLDLNHDDHRQILSVLQKILEDGAEREKALRQSLAEVTTSLRDMTKAFRDQSEAVSKLLDLRSKVRDLEARLDQEREANRQAREELEEKMRRAETQNRESRLQLKWVMAAIKMLMTGVLGAVGLAMLAAITGYLPGGGAG